MATRSQQTSTRRSTSVRYPQTAPTGRTVTVETKPMEIKREYNFPQVGEKDMYLLHHEEIESLAKNIPGESASASS